MSETIPPIMLAMSALDPSGCAGLQADIETAASLGCHCAPVATALLSTGSSALAEVRPVDVTFFIEQVRAVLEDMPVAAIKIGFTGSVAHCEAIHTILRDYPEIPVIIHPAFCLWDRDDPAVNDLPAALTDLLLPACEMALLTAEEAETLAGGPGSAAELAASLLARGARNLLISTVNPGSRGMVTTQFDRRGQLQGYSWELRTRVCHGAWSTLASAVAAFRAHGSPLSIAIEQAQNFAGEAMAAARQLGFGKPTPHRFFWSDGNAERPRTLPAGKTRH